MFRVAAVQMDSQADVTANLRAIVRMVTTAARRGARFVALPENALYLGPDTRLVFRDDAPEMLALRTLAADLKIWLLLGSVQEPGPQRGTKYNTSLLWDPRGREAARYRKMHLFRCKFPDRPAMHERRTLAGDAPTSARIGPLTAGLTICYDVRFPELYGVLAACGATLLCVPANFVARTGVAHWHTLLRARAIENQAYVIAPAQCGEKYNLTSYGHALIADPWGTVLAEASAARPGIITADLDPALPRTLRRQLPSLQDRRTRWRITQG